jgi:hypothetical protein
LPEMYVETLADSRRSMNKLFELPENIDLNLDRVLDEDWFPN